MGHRSHLDPDDERLPEGISRVGYDADTESYTFQDRSGAYWEGKPGRRYGPLRRVHTSPNVRTAPPDAPHMTRVDEPARDAREGGVSEDETGLCQGPRVESRDWDAGRCCEKHKATWEEKHHRTVTRRFSRLAGYLRGSLPERKTATRGLREKTFPMSKGGTSMSSRSWALDRAVTFDEILARHTDVECCTQRSKMKGR
ncbi:uncharacterized protein MAM_08093 [Metarhizium album ARSEF 1941]|uniref:Uncharacterized protein n=1 Tax=Metarhizium album (strain ARSEF 1941) TaxID=1081103 RepID=A0A0B2WK70_METAS|nr:uncharacterized protein MAM_08093 [Metarhizium album ARSEF 1941]KHN94084.1 hypothetical protein MAM_08093 [Metarhizium album ARSEF 1941]